MDAEDMTALAGAGLAHHPSPDDEEPAPHSSASEGDYVLFFTEGHRIYIEAGRLTSKSRK